VEDHLIERNVEHFSPVGVTPLGYIELGQALRHTGTGDIPMAKAILECSFEHEELFDSTLATIVNHLHQHAAVWQIVNPIITEEEFKSAFTCIPEKKASSFSGRGIHHYKARAGGSEDGLTEIQVALYVVMMTVPIQTGLCPEQWKKAIDGMLKNIAGVVRSNKLCIIQLLEADLNQVLLVAFSRNIAELAKTHKGIISDHHIERVRATCMAPVLKKLITFQLLLKKRTEGIVFDNDTKGCYDRIIIRVVLVALG
jgi:hypothetical protein